MGSDPAQFFVNLFLYYYENKWINKTKKLTLEGLDTLEMFLDSLVT